FLAPVASGPAAPTFSVAAGSSIVKNTTSAVTLTSSGNTIYYKWNSSENAYASAALVADRATSGSSPVAVTAPSATGATYLYAVAKDGDGNYSDVVSRSYTITNQTYTVTLNTNGGTINAGNITEYEEGTGATLPTNVTRDCYTFAGWYANAELTGDAVTTISAEATGNKTYWAKWTPKYALSRNFQAIVEAGTQAENPIATFLENANMEHSTFTSSAWETSATPSAAYVGFKFKDNGAYIKFLAEAGKEVTITLGNIAATLELYKDGVKTDIAASTGAGVQTVIPAFTPAEDMLVELRTTSAGTVTVKKIMIEAPADKFDVTYKANGSGEEDVVKNVSKVDENMFTYAGHAFTGWNTQANGEGADYAVGDDVTEELTLYAQWVSTYTVDFNLQGHGSAIAAQEVAEGGKAVAPTAPTASGWNFGGWYEEAACENEFDFNTAINANKTLYAKWTEDVKTTIFSMTVTSGSYSNESGEETAYTDATVTGGSVFGYGESGKALSTSSSKIKFGGGVDYIKLVLDNALVAGDVISFTCDNNSGLNFSSSNNGSGIAGVNTYTTGAAGPGSYTVKEGDAVINQSTIYCWRREGKSTNVTSITISRPAASITISNLNIEGEKDYATMYYGTVAVAVPAGVKACTYKVVDGKLRVSRTYENGGTYPVIPAGEAVVLEADVDASTGYVFNVSSTDTTVDPNNMLRGTDVATTVDATGYLYYKLAISNDGTKVGFYYDGSANDGSTINNGAHKAYLAVPTGGDAKAFFALGDEESEEPQNETDGIGSIENGKLNIETSAFNLSGQRVCNGYKGIVIINGKKVKR
ncbi:MAG: InlB B-repeat-containing protein, partial [Prevotella sp.]|nr:InlB B-repeat-containing protein [Prevotella sp.]